MAFRKAKSLRTASSRTPANCANVVVWRRSALQHVARSLSHFSAFGMGFLHAGDWGSLPDMFKPDGLFN